MSFSCFFTEFPSTFRTRNPIVKLLERFLIVFLPPFHHISEIFTLFFPLRDLFTFTILINCFANIFFIKRLFNLSFNFCFLCLIVYYFDLKFLSFLLEYLLTFFNMLLKLSFSEFSATSLSAVKKLNTSML